MSTCEEFRDLVLTDYIDGELDEKTKGRLEGHLRACAHCREFADEAKARLVVPFVRAPRAAVPEDLWRSIEQNIANEIEEARPVINWAGRLAQLFTLPRLVPVILSFILFISAWFWVLHNRQATQVASNDLGESGAYVLDSVGQLAETDNNNLGTSIEQYFL